MERARTCVTELREKFKVSEIILGAAGYETVNPFDLSEYHPDKTWEEYMVDDIRGLLGCNAIYHQSDWITSRGARVEHAIAEALGLHEMYEGVV